MSRRLVATLYCEGEVVGQEPLEVPADRALRKASLEFWIETGFLRRRRSLVVEVTFDPPLPGADG